MDFKPVFRRLITSGGSMSVLHSVCKARLALPDVDLYLLDDTAKTGLSSRLSAIKESLSAASEEAVENPQKCIVLASSRDIYAYSLSENACHCDFAALIILDTPITPFCRRTLKIAFKAPFYEAIFDENGVPLALDNSDGVLVPLLENRRWLALDRFGLVLPSGAWGQIACEYDGKTQKFNVCAEVSGVGAGNFCFRCAGLNDPGLLFPDGRPVSLPELHRAFSAFEVFDYRLQRNVDGYTILASYSGDIEPGYLESRLLREFPAIFPGVNIKIVYAQDLSEGERVTLDPEIRTREVFVFQSPDDKIPAEICENISPDLLFRGSVSGMNIVSSDVTALNSVQSILGGEEVGGDLSCIVVYGIQPEIDGFSVCLARDNLRPEAAVLCNYAPSREAEKAVAFCPVGAIIHNNETLKVDRERCIRCFACCVQYPEYFRAALNSSTALSARCLANKLANNNTLPGKHKAALDRLRGVENIGTLSFSAKPPVVLGLACVTMTENAAALLIDGELVAAIEEERLQRVKHYGWRHQQRPDATLASDPLLRLHEPVPQMAIQALLDQAGLRLEDVDAIAFNGLPHSLRYSYSKNETGLLPQILREGRLFFVPHHLAHAASTYCMSGFDRATVLSIDGRGDRETLALFKADGDSIALLADILYEPDRSIGGIYETFTRILGFGNFGQGSTMALAAYGQAEYDLTDYYSFHDFDNLRLSEWKCAHDFASFTREYSGPLEQKHKNLAASVQTALEYSVLKLLKKMPAEELHNLCICGGVGLNCRMNGRILEESGVENLFIPPGANDAGTAIGAAMLAYRELSGHLPKKRLTNAFLGPSFSSEEIGNWLKSKGIKAVRLERPAAECARLLAGGAIVCWFCGRMEFGPRALGARSILADPRRAELKDRLNSMKSRQDWRPFGVSILQEYQSDWFSSVHPSPFMLLALNVRPEKRALIPVAVHADGSSRPQCLQRADHAQYYDLIDEFRKLTGIPMLVNTSFNRGGEPIVCTPAQAFVSFARMGADALLLEDWLITREKLR